MHGGSRTGNLFWLTVALSLSGCAATTSVDSNYTFNRAAGKALVLLTITETREIREFPSLVYRRVGGAGEYQFKSFKGVYDAPLARRSAGKESDFNEALGSVLLVEVDPGDYQIYRWRVDVPTGFYYRDGYDYRFRAEAGEVSYIGNYHFNNIDRRTLLRQDRQERDVARFRQMFPKLNANVTRTSIESAGQSGNVRLEDLLEVMMPGSQAGPSQ